MRVKNRSVSVVGYNIPDLHIRRRFIPGEVKDIPKEEIDTLMYQPGGNYLLANYLQIHRDDLRQLDMLKPEHEYYLSEEQVKELVQHGSLDAFLDALDFAPQGVLDLIKNYSLVLPLSDLTKMDALKKKTGLDIAKMIANTKSINEENEPTTEATPSTTGRRRRVEVEEEEVNTPAPSKYTIVE